MSEGQAIKRRDVVVGTGRVRAVKFTHAGLPPIISGPCVIESEDHALRIAREVLKVCNEVGLPLIFKSSYDKANRTSAKSYRGVGVEQGLAILGRIREELNVPVVTDVHNVAEVKLAGKVVDLLQIPAFLCRQTDLLLAAGEQGKPVMVKKGQMVAPQDMSFAAEKIASTGNSDIILCERGACFGYRDLVVDFRAFDIMSRFGYPIVFDGTHSVQQMGGASGVSGGMREHIPSLVRGAVAAGVSGIFLETHDRPEIAPSDGANMLPLSALPPLLRDIKMLSQMRLETRP